MENQTHFFTTKDAEKYGIPEAIILNHIRYWCSNNLKNKRNIYDGKAYTYNSASALRDTFTYIPERSIARYLNNLEEKGAIILGAFNKKGYDKTKWYAINEEWNCLQSGKSISHFGKDISHFGELISQIGEPIPDNNTDNNTDRESKSPLPKKNPSKAKQSFPANPSTNNQDLNGGADVLENAYAIVERHYKGKLLETAKDWLKWVSVEHPQELPSGLRLEVMLKTFEAYSDEQKTFAFANSIQSNYPRPKPQFYQAPKVETVRPEQKARNIFG